MPLVTAEQIKHIVPTLTDARAAFVADLHNRICPTYGMNTAGILQEFIPNIAVESWSFRKREECLSYSAEALVKTWPKHFKDLEAAAPYARNPQKLANFIYGPGCSIGLQLGNTEPTDGWDLRGGGWMQNTGRLSYKGYQKHKGFASIVECANAVRGSDWYALDSACWVFAVQKNLIQAAIDNRFLYCVRQINGGTNGLVDRETFYSRALECLS